jgi:hypothetical protein
LACRFPSFREKKRKGNRLQLDVDAAKKSQGRLSMARRAFGDMQLRLFIASTRLGSLATHG